MVALYVVAIFMFVAMLFCCIGEKEFRNKVLYGMLSIVLFLSAAICAVI